MQGADAADATRLRWDWQHRRNPYNPTGQPGIWVAREGPTVVGHYPTLPVRVSLKGLEVDGAWGADAMVAPERDRQGLGEALVRAWDRNSGAVLALGASAEARDLLDRLHWPPAHIVPCLVKPLTRRAVRLPHLPTPVNRLISAVTWPVVQVAARSRPLRAECEPIRRFDRVVHDAVGTAGGEVRPRRPPRRGVPELALHRAAARALPDRGAEASGRGARLRRLPPSPRAARPRHAARRLPRRSRRRVRPEDAAALGRPRGARRGLRQGPLLRDERRRSAACCGATATST